MLAQGLVAALLAVLAPAPLFHLGDQRLDEISGIAVGIRSPGVAYVENDSGDSARFFALDLATGQLRATITVPDAVNHDWEDIAVAPDVHGTPSVWLGDIGDNDAERSQIELYRVDEPRIGAARAITSARPDVWTLRYPDGPHDAESLAVTGQGVPYIVTKSLGGDSEVFAAPDTPGAATLRRVGSIQFHLTGTPGPFAPLGELAATGADISRDGTRLVVRTYTDAYFWRIHGDDIAAALRTAPQRLALPDQPQGEGICFEGSHVLIDSEGVGTAVDRLPAPRIALPASTSTPRATPTVAPTSAAPPSRAATTARHGSSWAFPVLLALALAFVGAGGWVAVRIRSRARRAGSGSWPLA